MQSQFSSIPYAGCLAQMYFFLFFGDLESFLLVEMAFDYYVVIFFPLHFNTVMSPKLCISLVVLCCVLTMFHAMLHTLLIARFFLCIECDPPFFCDISALLKLSCSDTHVNELVIFIAAGLIFAIPFFLIVVSCGHIVTFILKVPSAPGIHKAVSTCEFHLSVVSLFYLIVIGLYLGTSANNSSMKGAVMALMYTVVSPMLNHFISNLRNRDMKEAKGRILKKIPFSL